MAYKYCVATNWGKDFFTARERMEFHLSEHPGNVWVVGDNIYGDAWIKKVSGDVKTKLPEFLGVLIHKTPERLDLG